MPDCNATAAPADAAERPRTPPLPRVNPTPYCPKCGRVKPKTVKAAARPDGAPQSVQRYVRCPACGWKGLELEPLPRWWDRFAAAGIVKPRGRHCRTTAFASYEAAPVPETFA